MYFKGTYRLFQKNLKLERGYKQLPQLTYMKLPLSSPEEAGLLSDVGIIRRSGSQNLIQNWVSYM